MNAETPNAVDLNLPQAFLLLATNDEDGKPKVPMFALRTGVAGAILAELDQIGAIELQGEHVTVTGTTPTADFQPELELIRHKSRPHTPERWITILESRAEVQKIYEGMASLGIVEQADERHLGLFRTVRYPEKDHTPEAAVLRKIEAAVSGALTKARESDFTTTNKGVADEGLTDLDASGGTTADPAKPAAEGPDARTTALIALLQAAGLLGELFPAADNDWTEELVQSYWPARAVDEEVRAIRRAEDLARARLLGPAG